MPKPLTFCLCAATILLSLGCPETRAQRGRDALGQVATLHRELHACHVRHARAFAATPAGAEARIWPQWPWNPLSDVDGLLVSKGLVKGYRDLCAGSPDQDLPANARAYMERRAALAAAAAEALEREAPVDPASLAGQVRAATLALWREDGAIVQKHLAAMEARGR